MKIKTAILALALALITLLPAVADNAQARVARCMQKVQENAQNSQFSYQSMAGDPSAAQLYQAEMQLHQTMFAYLQQLQQNPSALSQPGGEARLNAAIAEYGYRYMHKDYRPYAQIQGNIQQAIQYANWRQGTPEGLAAGQAELRSREAAFEQNQAAHRARVDAFDQSQASYRAADAQRDKNHAQYVEGIWDRTRWVNPYTGGEASLHNSWTNPYVQGPNGYYAPMVQYQNY